MSVSILSLGPEHRKNRLATTERHENLGRSLGFLVRCSSSLRLQLFGVETFSSLQSVKVMAAILRASVRRAISGFIPLASKAV